MEIGTRPTNHIRKSRSGDYLPARAASWDAPKGPGDGEIYTDTQTLNQRLENGRTRPESYLVELIRTHLHA